MNYTYVSETRTPTLQETYDRASRIAVVGQGCPVQVSSLRVIVALVSGAFGGRL